MTGPCRTFLRYFSIFVLTATFALATHAQDDKTHFVNPLIGTSNSRWMLVPGPTVPFGMVKLSPDNQANVWNGGYEYTIGSVAGFSHIHGFGLSGVSIMPFITAAGEDPKLFSGPADGPFGGMWTAGYRSRIRKEAEVSRVGYYSAQLIDAAVQVEATTTKRTGLLRVTSNRSGDLHLIYDFSFAAEELSELIAVDVHATGDHEIRGSLRQKTQYAGEYSVYFVSRFSESFTRMNSWKTGPLTSTDTNYGTDWRKNRPTQRNINSFKGAVGTGIWLTFPEQMGKHLVIHTAISFVSEEGAAKNLQAESADKNFDEIVQQADQSWNAILSTIDVFGGSDEDKTKFYTNFYRAYSAKMLLSDVDGSYRDMCGEVRQLAAPADEVYSADAFWGTQWNLAPLWTLATPRIASSWINFELLTAERHGWLTEAPVLGSYSPVMAAQHHIALLVGAYQKGVRSFDAEKAWHAIDHDLSTPGIDYSCGGFAGDRHLAPYLKYGFVPEEDGPASSTLEYAYDDWVASQFAQSLGYVGEASRYLKRSADYRNTFDASTGYMRRRHRDGKWVKPFDAQQFGTTGGWNGPGFVEGTPWVYTFFVPQDVPGLVNLLGRDEFNRRLEQGFQKGFVDLTNQPNLQAPWLFNYSGKPWLTQKYSRMIFQELWDASPYHGWPGEEDEGQMGALGVLSAIGLFDMTGGASVSPQYDVGSPAFDRIVIHLDPRYYPGGTFEIIARNNSPKNIYIQSATLNGKPLTQPRIAHDAVIHGGQLILEMGPAPSNVWQ